MQLLIQLYPAFVCCSSVYLVTVPVIAIAACLEQRFILASYCCHWSAQLNTPRLARQWLISISVQIILGTSGKCNWKVYGFMLNVLIFYHHIAFASSRIVFPSLCGTFDVSTWTNEQLLVHLACQLAWKWLPGFRKNQLSWEQKYLIRIAFGQLKIM